MTEGTNTFEGEDGPPATRRILSIDGGGIMGTFPAAFLATLEADLGRPIGDFFDLIAGTSTGGILALGLALGISAADLLDLYVNRGPHIFGQAGHPLLSRLGDVWRSSRHILMPKHRADVLKAELEAVLGEATIGDAKTRLIIPAWDADNRCVYIYKTAHHPRLTTDYKCRVLDAAMATAAAPTYFKRHRTSDDIGLLDGGVWANNPVALAVVEAITLLGWPRDSLRVLSLGCVNEVYVLSEAPGWGHLGRDVTRLFMDGQSRGALGMAKLLTGHIYEREAIFRVCPDVPKGLFKLDDTRKISRLRGLGVSIARTQMRISQKRDSCFAKSRTAVSLIGGQH
ncbi:MAG: patatin-like phospholipase family protein [Alphaproteobacteria bacterium]|nr:patatin-like phospholipase family protein [Alphaproteobacteria bacterium]MDE2495348.1 patatin-like phospholipase family protein [Alphaproteobacteria bacterium]